MDGYLPAGCERLASSFENAPGDALGFLVTAIGVLVVNAVAAVVAGCCIYIVQFLYHRYLRHPATMSQAPAGVR